MASSRLSLVKTTGDDGFDRPLKISASTGGGLHKVKGKTVTWGQLVARLTTDKRTDMTQKQYNALSQDAKQKEKMRAGFLFGGLCENGHRANANVQSRALVNLDIDNLTPSEYANFKFECGDPDANPLNKFEYVWYTTRSHTPEKPKFRIIVPLLESCDPDKYIAIARITGSKFDESMKALDKVSFVLAQMMYWPLTNRDGEFESGRNRGRFIDTDAELEAFGDWHDFSKLPAQDDEDLSTMRGRGAKQANPFEKSGIIGAFNRAYSIEDAINDFLSDVYEKTISTDKNERYTYLKSSTGQTGGMIAYPDEGLMFSHHSSDPCGNGHEYNAFDMVRVHLFSDLDQGSAIDNPTRTKSFKEMERFLENDVAVRRELMKENYDFDAMIDSAFADDAAKPAAKLKKAPKIERDELDDDVAAVESGATEESSEQEDDDLDELGNSKSAEAANWRLHLEADQNGVIRATVANVFKILVNDDRVKGMIGFNEFRKKDVKLRPFADGAIVMNHVTPYKDTPVIDDVNGELWSDFDDSMMGVFLSQPRGVGKPWYGIQASDAMVNSALTVASRANRFHPVKRMFESVKWDGKKRLETLFIDYFGCPDHPYYRETAKLSLMASVDRVYNPGSKWDHVPILEGIQGIAKSTFIRVLANGWFAELRAKSLEDNRMMAELFEGVLLVEIPELHSFSKAESSALKAFFSSDNDKARAAFARRTDDNKRLVTFWGSTNEKSYLRDKTGNRRYWPIMVHVNDIDIHRLQAERLQLWAEAKHYVDDLRKDIPYGDLPLYLEKGSEAHKMAVLLQDDKKIELDVEQHEGTLERWLNLPANVYEANCADGIPSPMFGDDDDQMVQRNITCKAEIIDRFLGAGGQSVDNRLRREVGAAISSISGWRSGGSRRTAGYGKQRVYVRIGSPEDTMMDLADRAADL